MYHAPCLQKASVERVTELAEKLDLNIDKDDIPAYHAAINNFLGKYAILDTLQEPTLPVKYPRTPGYRPPPEENKLNAWYVKTDIPGASSGLLHGKTVVLKDAIPLAGVPMMIGSRFMEGYVPDYDPTAITRLLDAGACIKGKGTCENMCWSGDSFTSAPRPVLNPHDPTRTVGGSCSGISVLVASGEADLGLGADTAGSIRIPSSCTGLVGMKPTYGLTAYTGIPGISQAFDTVGAIARNVSDCATMLQVIAGYDDGLDARQVRGPFTVPTYTDHLTGDLTGLKVGILKEAFEGAEPDVEEVVKAAAQQLTARGATVEEMSIPMHPEAHEFGLPALFEGVHNCNVVGDGFQVGPPSYYPTSMIDNVHAFARARAGDLPTNHKLITMLGHHVTEKYGLRFYAKSQNLLRTVRRTYDEKFKDYDVMVMPTVKFKPKKAPAADTPTLELITRSLSAIANTGIFSLIGYPAATINAGFSEGLPVGMQIAGRHLEDATVLKVAHAWEELRDAKK